MIDQDEFLEGLAVHLRGLTNGEVFAVAQACRYEIARRVDDADAIGDGPMVNALCALARQRFGTGLHW